MILDPQDLLGRRVGPYTVDRLIGHGGFAWVLAGRTAQDQPVALKVLKPRYAGDRQFEHRFRDEAAIAARLHHPNIVRILDVGQAEGLTYFAMDLYPDSLASRLARQGPLDEATLIGLAADVASGLGYAHDQGFVHRDVNANNILVGIGGTAVIADFGIAQAVSAYSRVTGSGVTIGTPRYMSPEQAQGRPLDGRSDLYSLGVTLYEAATGDTPFRSTDWFELARMHVEDRPERLRKKRSDLSARLERVIVKCLAKHPDDRYPSAVALRSELLAIADATRPTGLIGRTTTFRSDVTPAAVPDGRAKLVLAVVSVLLVLAVAALVVVLAR